MNLLILMPRIGICIVIFYARLVVTATKMICAARAATLSGTPYCCYLFCCTSTAAAVIVSVTSHSTSGIRIYLAASALITVSATSTEHCGYFDSMQRQEPP